MLQLVHEGEHAPSADQVADRANVGRRTVFRLFRDMDSVYAEMHAEILERIKPLRNLPIEGATAAERMQRLIDRRVRLFEEILPLKTAADQHRQRSAFLIESHHFMVHQLREILRSILPAEIATNREQFEALDAALSIDVWRRLRRDQQLSANEAEAVLRRIGQALL